MYEHQLRAGTSEKATTKLSCSRESSICLGQECNPQSYSSRNHIPLKTPKQPCAQGRAGADHTTLLLNCYTKLKDVAKLDEFLRGSTATSADGSNGDAAALPFDTETAVKVCTGTP